MMRLAVALALTSVVLSAGACGGHLSEFSKRVIAHDHRAARVTYRTLDSTDTGSPSTDSVWYVDGHGRERQEPSGGSLSLYRIGSNTIACDSVRQLCYDSPIKLASFKDKMLEAAKLVGDATPTAREIAGEPAGCFAGTVPSGTYDFCFAGDGVLLAISTSENAGHTASMEATAVDRNVKHDDVTPPYEFVDAP
jgi:hypothetical protein